MTAFEGSWWQDPRWASIFAGLISLGVSVITNMWFRARDREFKLRETNDQRSDDTFDADIGDDLDLCFAELSDLGREISALSRQPDDELRVKDVKSLISLQVANCMERAFDVCAAADSQLALPTPRFVAQVVALEDYIHEALKVIGASDNTCEDRSQAAEILRRHFRHTKMQLRKTRVQEKARARESGVLCGKLPAWWERRDPSG
jgi:hypothetical protein